MRDTMPPGRPPSRTDATGASGTPRLVARVLLLGLGALLPFESPIVSLGPLTITTVELVIYLLFVVWGLDLMSRAARAGLRRGAWASGRASLASASRDPMARAVAVWLAVNVICALLAPAHRVPALKFALRATSGGLLFFAARDLLSSAGDARRFGLAIVGGAALSAAGAIVESVLPNTAGFWHPFRTTTFTVTGLPRPSGPFAYPTIAAMYWEAVLPLAIVLPLTARDSRKTAAPQSAPPHPAWTGTAVAILLGTLLIAAILFSATRTALFVAALASGAMTALTWRSDRRIRVAAVSTLALVGLLAGMTLASPAGASPLAMRLRWWQDGNWYLARYGLTERTLQMEARSLNQVPITVENTGALVWPHAGADAVRLSYHFEKTDNRGAHLDFEGRRSALPFDVPPGASVRVLGTVQAPEEAGRYRLRWDLVRENVTWFSERGNPTADQTVDVVKVAAGTRRRKRAGLVDSTLEDFVSSFSPTRPELWRAALRLWWRHPLWGVGPDNFRRAYPQALSRVSRDPAASYDPRIHANSLYFETLADLGLAGICALALLMVTVARTAWRSLSALAAPVAAAYAIAVGTFFVHGLLDWFLEFTPTYGLYWLLLAHLVAGADRQRSATALPA